MNVQESIRRTAIFQTHLGKSHGSNFRNTFWCTVAVLVVVATCLDSRCENMDGLGVKLAIVWGKLGRYGAANSFQMLKA